MQSSATINMLRQQFDLSDDRWLIAQSKAEELGLDISEYISVLIDEDDDPCGPVPELLKVQWAVELARQRQQNSIGY